MNVAKRRTKVPFVLRVILVNGIATFLSGQAPGFAGPKASLEYFKRIWKVSVKASPEVALTWTVESGFGSTWLIGSVVQDRKKTSADPGG
jgi:hypothetical protein